MAINTYLSIITLNVNGLSGNDKKAGRSNTRIRQNRF